MNVDDNESILEGGVNKSRTKCKCRWCEEIFALDPSWDKDSTCPTCEENLFSYACSECSHYSFDDSDDPAFPDLTCGDCGRTRDQIKAAAEEDEERANAEREENLRVSTGASFRAAKIKEPFPVYQNNIRRTYKALYGKARPGSPPESESDALRMREEDWGYLRPLVVAEMADPSEMTKEWCLHNISVFERSWQSDNMAGLERGTEEDWTGKTHHLIFAGLTVGLRSLRETQMEEGMLPIAPAVKLNIDAWLNANGGGKLDLDALPPLSNFVSWDPLPPNFDSDPREIYKADGNKELSFFEFLLWSARVGGFGNQAPSKQWTLEDCTPEFRARRLSTIEPTAYVPTDWVGRPNLAQEDSRRWHWIREQAQKGDFNSQEDCMAKINANINMCSVCYGPAKEALNLIVCECESVLWCSEECRKSVWELHTLDHRLHHAKDVVRTCLSCGNKGDDRSMTRCETCENAFFCGPICQKVAYHHKKECFEYVSSGRPAWSNIS